MPEAVTFPSVGTANAASAPKAARNEYVDALRVALILLVVAHHSVEAYVAGHAPEIVFADAPIPRVWAFLAVNAAFFMGLFFFLAGYYTPAAFDRKGAGRYLADRWERLGIPLLIGFALVVPLAMWIRADFYPGFPHVGFWEYLTRNFLGFGAKPDYWPAEERWPQLNLGPLWFVEHLLVYAMLYAAWRALAPARKSDAAPPAPPSSLAIIVYAVALAAVSYAIRLVFPVNAWIAFLGFIQMEPAHLPQYASLFVIGLIAGRGRWIETMPRRQGLVWLAWGVGLSVFLYAMVGAGIIGGGGGVPARVNAPDWKGVVWESFTCTALCVGLPVAFREVGLGTGRLWKLLARNVFAIYVFHFPIVFIVQAELARTDLPKWGRLLLTWPAAVALTLLLTQLVVLRLPGLRRIF